MIQERIKAHYPHHLTVEKRLTTEKSIYVADHSLATQGDRNVELVDDPSQVSIEHFTLNNPPGMTITGLPFSQKSFRRADGQFASQCECVIYPKEGDEESWICFVELKYSAKPANNRSNLMKARRQLLRTQACYRYKQVINKRNTCYLFASLPKQTEPFLHFTLTQSYLIDLKRRFNIVLGFKNSAEVLNHNKLRV